jgi:hypothetical protein
MKTILAFSILLAANLAYGYSDNDLDGIEDRYDRCPNTPFDAKVDKYGCTVKKTDTNIVNKGLTLRIGTTYRTDDVYDNNFYHYSNFNVDYAIYASSKYRAPVVSPVSTRLN